MNTTPPAQPPRPRPWRRKRVTIPAVVVLAVATLAVLIIACGAPRRGPAESTHGSQTPQPTTGANTQTVLPFTGLTIAEGVAVDTAGNVYVVDANFDMTARVLKLAVGSTAQTVLPFTDLRYAAGVAVDTAGNVYVTDAGNARVLKLAAGSTAQTVLPFTDLSGPVAVAVDTAGNVYVTDQNNKRVLKLAAGSTAQTVLPFTDLSYPTAVAVDAAGNVYVTDHHSVIESGPNNHSETKKPLVLKLAVGSTAPTVLPFTGLSNPDSLAVDAKGSVYVACSVGDGGTNRVLKLAAGSTAQTELPFTGLSHPQAVAVDTAGSVYVIDVGGGARVLKLAAS